MGDVLDVLDLVEGEVKRRQIGEVLEATADVGDEVVVEVEFLEGGGYAGEAFDVLDEVLAEADADDFLEAREAEGGDRLNTGVGANDLIGFGVFVVEEV